MIHIAALHAGLPFSTTHPTLQHAQHAMTETIELHQLQPGG